MAGMFYSLQEVARKLNMTEEQVREIVKDGRLREFRDGPNLLFKIDEVEALMSDSSIMAARESPAPPEPQAEEEEISLVSEPAEEADLSNADTTAIGGEELDILGEAGGETSLADETIGETKAASDEASLEEIEEDVNLDTFGSGSGLLDLSLQADDTSLGGILDEIYTSEESEAGQEETAESASAMDVAAETGQMLSAESGFAVPEPIMEAPAVAGAYTEPKPDTLSNAFGIMLFLPLLAIIYTAIVAVAGFNDVMPTILEKTQSIIWYIMIGAAVVAISIVGTAFMLSGSKSKVAKKPKAKREKKPKVKKEKKPKKKKKAKS